MRVKGVLVDRFLLWLLVSLLLVAVVASLRLLAVTRHEVARLSHRLDSEMLDVDTRMTGYVRQQLKY